MTLTSDFIISEHNNEEDEAIVLLISKFTALENHVRNLRNHSFQKFLTKPITFQSYNELCH